MRKTSSFIDFLVTLSVAPVAFLISCPVEEDPIPPASGLCEVVNITRGAEGENSLQLSHDGTLMLANKRDNDGVFQLFVGPVGGELECISCEDAEGAPPASTHKLMAAWHPSGDFVFFGSEMEGASYPIGCNQECIDALQISGINLDMYVAKTDGSLFKRLVAFDSTKLNDGSGYTGPHMTPDGNTAFWSKIIDGNIFVYSFGKWLLMQSEFTLDDDGVPSLENHVDVTPEGANWVETGNFAPDGKTLLLSTDIGLEPNAAFGQDQWALDTETGELTQLTNTPDVWDEHGLFSPDGKKVVWMSSLPYRKSSTWIGNIKTEFLLMNADGSNVEQVTHFNAEGFPESDMNEPSLAAVAFWSADGTRLTATQLKGNSRQTTWDVEFAGPCGNE